MLFYFFLLRPVYHMAFLNNLKMVYHYRTQVFSALKKMLLFMEDPVNDWLQRKIRWLRNEDTVAHGIRWAQDVRFKFFPDLFHK